MGPIELAPGESEGFSGSYTVTAGAGALTVTASGFDICQARKVSAAANCSGPVVEPSQPRAITVVINGNGTVSGVANGQLLNLGQSYTATATPAAGASFVNWSGGVSGTSTSLTYVMRSNLVLIANFALINTNGSNSFTPVAGTFKGLFLESNEVQNARSGYFTFVLTDKGTYTASLLSEGRKYSTSGRLSLEGRATNTIARTRTNELTVVWDLRRDGADTISGRVTDGRWIAELTGDRAIFNTRTNPAPQAGRYTLVIPGTTGSINSPEGDGYGAVTVDGNGMVSFAGTLADGTKVTQKGCISKNGEWPLYVSLYSGRGSLLGWLLFTNRAGDDVSGRLSWISPTNSNGKFYPAGFGVDSDALGSRYVAPVGPAKVLEITDGAIILSGGNRSRSSTNDVTLGAKSKITNVGTNTLTLSFTLSSGLFKGSYVEDGTTRKTAFSGAVLQKANHGSGYFLGTNQSGRVVFRTAP